MCCNNWIDLELELSRTRERQDLHNSYIPSPWDLRDLETQGHCYATHKQSEGVTQRPRVSNPRRSHWTRCLTTCILEYSNGSGANSCQQTYWVQQTSIAMEYCYSSEDVESLNILSDELLDWVRSEDSPMDALWLDGLAKSMRTPCLYLPGPGPSTP